MICYGLYESIEMSRRDVEARKGFRMLRGLESALWGAAGGSRVRLYTYSRSTIPERPQ
jgi:hypothetical protein